ncbi:MAG: hypothetical protein MHM6MM_004230 [Cercozoa sp. M6MM]
MAELYEDVSDLRLQAPEDVSQTKPSLSVTEGEAQPAKVEVNDGPKEIPKGQQLSYYDWSARQALPPPPVDAETTLLTAISGSRKDRGHGGRSDRFGVWIAGFPWWTTERALYREFSRYGRVLSLRIFSERISSRSRSYAFVLYLPKRGSSIESANDIAREAVEDVTERGVRVDGTKLKIGLVSERDLARKLRDDDEREKFERFGKGQGGPNYLQLGLPLRAHEEAQQYFERNIEKQRPPTHASARKEKKEPEKEKKEKEKEHSHKERRRRRSRSRSRDRSRTRRSSKRDEEHKKSVSRETSSSDVKRETKREVKRDIKREKDVPQPTEFGVESDSEEQGDAMRDDESESKPTPSETKAVRQDDSESKEDKAKERSSGKKKEDVASPPRRRSSRRAAAVATRRSTRTRK